VNTKGRLKVEWQLALIVHGTRICSSVRPNASPPTTSTLQHQGVVPEYFREIYDFAKI